MSPSGRGEGIFAFDQEPLLLLPLHAYEMKRTLQFFAVQDNTELSRFQLCDRIFGENKLIPSSIPDNDFASSVVPLRNMSGKVKVLDRMILNHHGEVLLTRIKRWSFRDGPRFQNPTHLQTKIIVKM